MPLYWELWELERLQGSPSFAEALRLYKHVARQYAYLYKRFMVCKRKGLCKFCNPTLSPAGNWLRRGGGAQPRRLHLRRLPLGSSHRHVAAEQRALAD